MSYIKTRNIINSRPSWESSPSDPGRAANQRRGVGGGRIPRPKRATGVQAFRGRAGKFGARLPHPGIHDCLTGSCQVGDGEPARRHPCI